MLGATPPSFQRLRPARRLGRFGGIAVAWLATASVSLVTLAVPTASAAASQAAPKSLVAARLATASALSAAGVPASGIQDDGGAQTPEAFSSQVEVMSKDGTPLTITLATYASSADARSAYSASASSGATPLPGVGDRAATSGNDSYVLKGSQVLTVEAKLSAAAVQQEVQAKEQGGAIPANLGAAAAADATAVAKGLGTKLTGTAAKPSASYHELPAGAVDPCATAASAVASALGVQHVTSQEVLTDTPPAQECQYSSSAGTFDLYTITAAQAAAAVPPTTVAAVIARDSFASGAGNTSSAAASSGGEGAGATAQFGPSTVTALVGPDTSVTMLYQAPPAVQEAAKELGIAVDTTETNSFKRVKELCDQIYQMAREDMGTYVGVTLDQRWEHALNRKRLTDLCDNALSAGSG
jgi:hypothetical protein